MTSIHLSLLPRPRRNSAAHDIAKTELPPLSPPLHLTAHLQPALPQPVVAQRARIQAALIAIRKVDPRLHVAAQRAGELGVPVVGEELIKPGEHARAVKHMPAAQLARGALAFVGADGAVRLGGLEVRLGQLFGARFDESLEEGICEWMFVFEGLGCGRHLRAVVEANWLRLELMLRSSAFKCYPRTPLETFKFARPARRPRWLDQRKVV